MKARIPTEKQEQKAFIQWLSARKIFFTAISNENQFSSMIDKKAVYILEANARSMGKVKGFPDLLILPKGGVPLFIELKRVKGSKIYPEQLAIQAKLTEYGYYSYICYGAREAMKVTLEHITANSKA